MENIPLEEKRSGHGIVQQCHALARNLRFAPHNPPIILQEVLVKWPAEAEDPLLPPDILRCITNILTHRLKLIRPPPAVLFGALIGPARNQTLV